EVGGRFEALLLLAVVGQDDALGLLGRFGILLGLGEGVCPQGEGGEQSGGEQRRAAKGWVRHGGAPSEDGRARPRRGGRPSRGRCRKGIVSRRKVRRQGKPGTAGILSGDGTPYRPCARHGACREVDGPPPVSPAGGARFSALFGITTIRGEEDGR